MSRADANHRAWLAGLLRRAAGQLAVTVADEPTFGWHDRSIGARTTRGDGESSWLRVVTERHAWADDDFWTGNVDAGVIKGVAKPEILDIVETDEGEYRVRAELMTFVPGRPCSPTHELRHAVGLDDTWWASLRQSVGHIRATPTTRSAVTQADVTRRFGVFWGDRVSPTVLRWGAAHADLHWAHVYEPTLAIVDWELWGTAPDGYDAATLYCLSLLVPDVMDRLHGAFADVLDTPDGMRSQLYVIARLLLRTEHGDFPDLAVPLHHHAERLIEMLAGT